MAALLTTVIVLAGCGSSGSGAPSERSSGISGTVVSGPHCPVERADSPCPDQPVIQAKVVVLARDGSVAGRAVSDDRGQFGLYLPAGTYAVTVEGLTGIRFAKPVSVVVRPGAFTKTTVVVDTGIRVPDTPSD